MPVFRKGWKKKEFSVRSDGKFNIWEWMKDLTIADPISQAWEQECRYVLVDVCNTKKEARRKLK